ncbi:MAG: class I SAM-dependent methyltransferase [Minisyncoccia bacterium]
MRINKVLNWYTKSYYRSARGQESGRGLINVAKEAMGGDRVIYKKIKKIIIKFLIGYFYWPTTWPTSIDPPTSEFLYGLTRLMYPRVAVEIGTYKGNAAIAIGQALKDNGRGVLHTIDPVEQELVYTAIRKSGFKSTVFFHKGFSGDVIPRLNLSYIDLVFIDGDHSYESVRKDFELVAHLIPKGGVIVFHDVLVDIAQGFDGPRRVIEEIQKLKEWRVNIYSTEAGVNKGNKVVLRGDNPDFKPLGLAVCIKI